MDIKTFKSAIRTENHPLIAQGVREERASGSSERAIFRLALAAVPNLDEATWTDMVELSLAKNPGK
jgi:hypothetical protein